MTTLAVGDRLRCEKCGTEVIVVKAADGPLSCCGGLMADRAEEVTGGKQPG